jgi:BirA family transcriptional regulator, biotin operon repressor / biotin---[acetyl-CoA-carboxylase] ligase
MPIVPTRASTLAARLEARRDELRTFAADWRALKCVSSTNDVAIALALDGTAEGTWVVADEQTEGRGRRGRTWVSPPSAGLYCSIVFRPARASLAGGDSGGGDALLTLMAGVAASEAIRALGVEASLKWPNDVMVGRTGAAGTTWRKLGGILAEASTAGTELQFVVVGVGVNLTRQAYPVQLASRATSLEDQGINVDRDSLLLELLASMARWRSRMQADGGLTMLERWRALSPMAHGTEVRWTGASGTLNSGRTRGIDRNGALLVETQRGIERIVSGEVFWPGTGGGPGTGV